MGEEEFLHFENEGYIYQLFEKYQKDPKSVPKEWLRFFQGVELSDDFLASSVCGERVVDYFKKRGHLYAKTNSLEKREVFDKEKLMQDLNLSSSDLEQHVSAPSLGIESISLHELINQLEKTFCQDIGLQAFVQNGSDKEKFLTKKLWEREKVLDEEKALALKEVGRAKLLEDFLQKKFLGAKRFSVEGGESVLSLLKVIVNEASKRNYQEGYIGMAHRGRINTLCHIMGKPYREIFTEFQTTRFPKDKGVGDVKYHNGYQNKVSTYCGKEIYLQMAANPSHLEAVDAVLPGMVRARLDDGLEKALQIVVHGDAAVSGQGIVYETMQFSGLEGYTTKGTIHVVIDNHIGFTTFPEESRSTLYATDIAKAFSVPVLHVDAWDLEAVIYAAKVAVEYKDTFSSDVFIHYNCHRLYGHNEGDEPIFTNPSLYKKIRSGSDIYSVLKELYMEKKYISQEEIESFEQEVKKELSENLEKVEQGENEVVDDFLSFDNTLEEGGEAYLEINTNISTEIFGRVKGAIAVLPKDFHIHPKVAKLVETRAHMLENVDEQLLDWGCAELMAYGSIIAQGKKVRLSGQDSRRGTFSHRHSVYIDQEEEDRPYFPLDMVEKGAFTVFNSPLSEYGVMGFEYGYSLTNEGGLVIWEAQFGDFYNGGTIIIDQYLSATLSKWKDDSSLVLLLPHGNEGMGSEHSSGRMERFLQLSARNNMRVFNPTTSAQIFHLLRAQALSEERIPLIVFTPKSGLRKTTSCAKELLEGALQPVIVRGTGKEEKLVFCSGKLAAEIEEKDVENKVAICKLEQLYPFPQKEIEGVIKDFSHVKKFIYAQEEPKNQGAYSFVKDYLQQIIGKKGTLEYVGRKRLESTAEGFSSLYKYNQEKIITKVVEG